MIQLLISSAVYSSSNKTFLVNSEYRLKQYIESIKFFLNQTCIDVLIVCDSSGFDYSSYFQADLTTSNRLEFLHFQGNSEKIAEKGKGFGEGELIRFIFDNSKLFNDQADGFLKVTGRLLVENIKEICKEIDRKKVYFNSTSLNPLKKTNKLDTKFYYCQSSVYRSVLFYAYEEVDDMKEHYLEHVFYQKLSSSKVHYESFPIIPIIKGQSGSTGELYDIPKWKLTLLNLITDYISKMKSFFPRKSNKLNSN